MGWEAIEVGGLFWLCRKVATIGYVAIKYVLVTMGVRFLCRYFLRMLLLMILIMNLLVFVPIVMRLGREGDLHYHQQNESDRAFLYGSAIAKITS